MTSPHRRRRAAVLAVALALAAGASPAAAGPGSAGRATAASDGGAAGSDVRVTPARPRVGEVIRIRVAVSVGPEHAPGFPAAWPRGPYLEPVGRVDVRAPAGGERWIATYRARAWRAGTVDLPALRVEFGTGGTLRVEAGSLRVRSVLPPETGTTGAGPARSPDGEELPLRPPRLRVAAGASGGSGAAGGGLLPLAAVLAVLGAAGLLWRRRARSRDAEATGDAGSPAVRRARSLARARRRLREAEDRWRRDELDAAGLYGELEAALRTYLAGAEGWPPGRLLTEAGAIGAPIREVLRRSASVRFGDGVPGPEECREAARRVRRFLERRGRTPAGDAGP